MVRNTVLTMGFWCATAGLATARPPGLPTAPETEFKVLSPLAQDFHQADGPTVSSLHVPVDLGNGAELSEAAVGIAARLAHVALPTQLMIRGGCSSFISHVWNVRFSALSGDNPAKDRLAKAVFEMAEAHRMAGDWAEARRWYNGVKELYPQTSYARLAAERLERYHLLRVLADAGEEQSEEPPIAEAHGAEILTVPPREAR